MDGDACAFVAYVQSNPWAAITEPLPESLDDPAALLDLRSIVYAVIQTLRWSLDDSLELIGRLAELDRHITLIERLRRGACNAATATTGCVGPER